MDKFFDIIYFDGKSAQRQEAILTLREYFWEISFPETGEPPVQWALAEIRKNETVSRINTFNFGEFPYQTIQCADPGFIQALSGRYPKAGFVHRGYKFLASTSWRGIAVLSIALLALCGLFFFVLMPNTAAYLAGRLPIETEIKLGDKMAMGLMESMDVDSAKTQTLREFAQHIDFQTRFPLDFTVVESEDLNAFALPGGKIVVFSRMLDVLPSSEALAALLGHEAAHVEERHALKSIARNLSGYLFISLVFGDLNGITAVLMDNAQQFRMMRFSRSLEHQADERALKTLEHNHLDQKGMVALFQTFKDELGDEPEELQFFSSHPLTEDRLDFAEKTAATQTGFHKKEALDLVFERIRD